MRHVLFDNARVAVKEGAGKNAIPQESYAALAAHYCFQTDFCNAASGNEKGLVENLVGWTRRNLLVPVPRVASLAELNQRLRDGCESYIASHQVAGKPHPVAYLLQEERQALLPLPGRPYDVRHTEVCRISLQATVRFQGNAYSVPVQYAGQEAALKAGAEREYDARQEKTRQRRLKRAHFPLHKTLEEFDLARLQHIQPEFVKQLASCTYIDRHENLVLMSNPGTGKTHLMTALGIKACLLGYKVQFANAATLASELKEARDGYQLRRLEKGIAANDLLLIDELSYARFN